MSHTLEASTTPIQNLETSLGMLYAGFVVMILFFWLLYVIWPLKKRDRSTALDYD